MESAGSTLIGPPREGRTGSRPVTARIVGGSPVPRTEMAALLLPMVRRAVRTERGPAALVSWLRRCPAPAIASDEAERVAALAAGLVRLLFEPSGSPTDTLDDSRARPRPAPAADST